MPKQTIKKVEIGLSDSIVDLKAKERRPGSFKVQRIEEEETHVLTSDDDTMPSNHQDIARQEMAQQGSIQQGSIQQGTSHQGNSYQRMENFVEKVEDAIKKITPSNHMSHQTLHQAELKTEPKELVKVKFTKFVQLVASRDFVEVLEKNQNEDLIMSSNLLTDLAGAMDEKSEKKVPVVFLVGLAIGVVLTYILINK